MTASATIEAGVKQYADHGGRCVRAHLLDRIAG
jgi:hypothetical protein